MISYSLIVVFVFGGVATAPIVFDEPSRARCEAAAEAIRAAPVWHDQTAAYPVLLCVPR